MEEDQLLTQTEDGQKDGRGFEVQLAAFSGPLDLLCHLVDSREMDPVKLNLTELISQYVRFLLASERTTLNEMAEFFSFASRLLYRKVHSLFPSQPGEEAPEEPIYEEEELTEEDLRRMLEAFRPYRSAAVHLATLQLQRERCFVRILDDESTPYYDLGDLYSLASRWWGLLDDYGRRTRMRDEDAHDLWDDIPDAVPEERQVEQRMEELALELKGKKMPLRKLLQERNRKVLIVTLLALLEMSRLGMVHIEQAETLGEVFIGAA
ncbi:segregation/condensation protein A [Synergistaceae bacterium OttesenSCG-928-D05]|nr:segregation/condensation protein A [Synergistaceae bacterium OttesenSCG-928-D05]